MVRRSPGHGEVGAGEPTGIKLPMRIKESLLRTGQGPER